VDYYDARIWSQPVDVVRTLFTDIRRELDASAEQEARLLKRWGFDGPRLSPYTGRPYCPARDDYGQRPTSWRDPTVVAALGGQAGAEEIPTRLPVAADFPSLGWPSLMTFDVPLEPRGDASVVVRYEVKVRPMDHPSSLLRAMQSKGAGEDAYPFVERFYHEFVKGKPAHNHLPCVGAFEAVGDKRAIPYLEEIIRTTERKTDAARAIGNLILDRRVKLTKIDIVLPGSQEQDPY
jgi:hypothetical protein